MLCYFNQWTDMLMSINKFTNIHVKIQFLKQNCEDKTQNLLPRSEYPRLQCSFFWEVSPLILLYVALVLYILLYIYIQYIFIDMYTILWNKPFWYKLKTLAYRYP